jgi:cyclic pyranopterin phosphate synthase
MHDRYGRNIDYLRVSLTDRCNLRCIYCMPEEGVVKKSHEDIMRFEEMLKVIKVCASLGIRKVRFTGGEPLVVRDIERLIYETAAIPSIDDISMTTNGILLYDMAPVLKKAGLGRVNISLDTLDKDKFKSITRGGDIGKVLSAINRSLEIGLNPVKINNVVMRGINDDEIDDFINLTRELPVQVRFIELMPIGEGSKLYESGMMSSDEIIESHSELHPVKDGSRTARVFKLKDAKGTIGFISPLSCKFCADCNRIRLTAGGTIKPCLHSEREFSIRQYADNEVLLASMLKSIIHDKPLEHHLETDKVSKSARMMYQIGG